MPDINQIFSTIAIIVVVGLVIGLIARSFVERGRKP